jgi:hypothetical protein
MIKKIYERKMQISFDNKTKYEKITNAHINEPKDCKNTFQIENKINF